MRTSGGGGEAVAAEENVRNLRQVRRPSVRLQQSYMEIPKFVLLNKPTQQKEPIKKDAKNRQVKYTVSKTLKNCAVIVNCTDNEKENEKEKEKEEENEMLDDEDEDEDDINVAIGNWRTMKTKARRKRNRPSSSNNWVSEKSIEKNETETQSKENETLELSSESESENQEENNSNDDDENGDKSGNGAGGNASSQTTRRRRRRRTVAARVAEESKERDGNGGNGVRAWLDQLGLEKYAVLFETHEVDEETLPLLTMDDLKDMGINAIGSRRKMYASIQKRAKGIQ